METVHSGKVEVTPDELHRMHTEAFERGKEHRTASKETITLLGQLQNTMENKIQDVENRFLAELDTKVGKWAFGLVLSITMSVVVGMFYLVWSELRTSTDKLDNKIEKIEENTEDTSVTVSQIQGKLEPFDFVIK